MSQPANRSSAGFTLVEVVLTMGLSLLTLSLLYSIYVRELHAQQIREEVLDAQQRARVVVDLISRELLMAGYDPAGVNDDTNPANDFSGVWVDTMGLQIKADLSGNGLLTDPNESTTFSYDPVARVLRRNTGGGNQPLVEDLESFQVRLLDKVGSQAVLPQDVRAVELSVAARTTRPDPRYLANGGFRVVVLQGRVSPRNLER